MIRSEINIRTLNPIRSAFKSVANLGLKISIIKTSLLLIVFLLSSFAVCENSVLANNNSTSPDQLQNSVRRLNVWLSGNGNAQAWRRYLLLNLLETQTAKGDQADISTLLKVRDRFAQPNDGLKHPALNDVRLALDSQINRLGSKMVGDLRSAVLSARERYNPTSIATMTYQRSRAVYELKLLKKYYRATMPSRNRASIFYDLELDETIAFLEGIEFELAPEISAGKIGSMIRDVQRQRDEVEKQLDALPVTPEPDDDEEGEDKKQEQLDSELPPIGPIPDSGEKTQEDLEREKRKIEARLKILSDQRKEILAEDKPRRDKRNKTFRRLLDLETNFVDLSKTQTDPYFVSAAMTFEQFTRTYIYGTSDNLQEEYLRKLEEVEENLQLIDSGEARSGFGKLGDNLRWLENANQAKGLVAAIRSRYSNPNIYVGISGKLINRLGGQNISTLEPLRETVDGRLIRGNVQIGADVKVELQNDPNQIHANVRLNGNLASSIYLQERSVQVFTGANGQLEAVQSIYANVGGLFASNPKVAARISAYFSGTSSRLRLINNIAAKKFAELQNRTESSTAKRAEEQLREQFESQTKDALSTGQQALEKAQDALSTNATLAPQIYLRSTNSQIVVVGKKSSISTLGAPDYPLAQTVPTDVGVRIHETLLSNFLDRTFRGKTFTDKQLAEELAEMMGGDAPAMFSPTEEEEGEDNSFSITFDSVRPIQFEFDRNGLGVSIAGRRFAQGDRKINTGLRIGLRFKIKRIQGKLKLVRDGKATLEYVGEKNAKAITFRSVLDGRLNPKDGGDQIEIELPENLLPIEQFEQLKESEIATQMKLVQCRTENGWLYLGWNHQPPELAYQSIMDIPAIWTEATVYEFGPSYIDSITPLESVLTPGSSSDQSAPPLPVGAVLLNEGEE